MSPSDDERFEKFLRHHAAIAKRELGFPGTLFLRMLGSDGGYATAAKLLSGARPSEGFSDLVLKGRADLTVEAIVVESEWRTHFDQLLIERAEERLRKVDYEFSPYQPVLSGSKISEALPPSMQPFPERVLPVSSADAVAAVEFLKEFYGAVLTWESRKEGRQQGEVPLRIYSLENGSQVAIRMNKIKPAIYVRKQSVHEEDIEIALRGIAEPTKRYTGEEAYEAPSSILSHAAYLRPSPANVLLRFNPSPGFYKHIFRAALGVPSDEGVSAGSLNRSRHVIDEITLLLRLEKQRETGRRGELEAVRHEMRRLEKVVPPCPNPEKYVRQISMDDVSAGYDIVSTWPGEERYIEVKATNVLGAIFFLVRTSVKSWGNWDPMLGCIESRSLMIL